MKVKSENEVAQSCLTLSDRMDYSLPGSSTHGISQARVLEWGAIGFASGFYCSFFFFYIHKEYCSVVFSSYVSCFGIFEVLASWNELKSKAKLVSVLP